MQDVIISFLSGGVAGSLITYFLTRRNEKENRKRAFLAFMAQWKSEVETCGQPQKLAEDFSAKVHVFMGEADKVRRDFYLKLSRTLFDGTCQAVRSAGHKIGALNERKELVGRVNTLSAFDAVVKFFDRG